MLHCSQQGWVGVRASLDHFVGDQFHRHAAALGLAITLFAEVEAELLAADRTARGADATFEVVVKVAGTGIGAAGELAHIDDHVRFRRSYSPCWFL